MKCSSEILTEVKQLRPIRDNVRRRLIEITVLSCIRRRVAQRYVHKQDVKNFRQSTKGAFRLAPLLSRNLAISFESETHAQRTPDMRH
jgi:hypothetical protein